MRKIVVACGGRFDDDLDPATTTHLIAEAVGSLKHRAAVSHELPVASPRWIFESFRAQKLLHVNKFGLRLLEGMRICTTGLTMEEKELVSQLVTTNGGQYDGRLESGFTTILIARHAVGAKYEAAVATDIPVVHLGWLYACLERQLLVDEDDFALRFKAKDRKLQSTNIAIHQQKATQDLVKNLTAIVQKFRLRNGCTNVNEDWMDLFDGCVVYFLGFSPHFHALLQRLIRSGMGTIYHQMVVHHVTHVVVSASLNDKQTLEAIRARVVAANYMNMVHFVSASWIIDCVKCLDLQPEELYPVELDECVSEPPSRAFVTNESSVLLDSNCTNVAKEVNKELITVSENSIENVDMTSTLEPSELTEEKKNIFSGYSFLLLCRDPGDKHLIKPLLKKIRESGGAEAYALLAMDFIHLDPEQFSFITHAVVCTGVIMDEPEALKMQERIHHIQRQVRRAQVDTKEQEIENKSSLQNKPRQRMLQFVPDLWLTCSLAANTKLSFSSHELFNISAHRPRALFPCPVPITGFHDVVASTSVYLDVEQLVVIQLLQLAGAQVTKKLSTQNTHLICRKAIGMKFAKATKWGLHVVKARWVVESLLQGKRLSEDHPDFQVVEDEDGHVVAHAASEGLVLSQASSRS